MLASTSMGRQASVWLCRGVASWSKCNPAAISGSNPAQVSNLGARPGGRGAWGAVAAAAPPVADRCLPQEHEPLPLLPALPSTPTCSVWRVGAH